MLKHLIRSAFCSARSRRRWRSPRSTTQRIGIVPDIEVRPTLAGIRAGRDEVLDAAIAEIHRQ